MDTQEIAFEMDMATMALKGRRFREAEEKFKDLALRTNTTETWCGLGISKYGLIMEDITVEEVFYCFDKAKSIDTAKIKELETVVIETSIDVIKNLYDVVLLTQQSIEKAETEKTKAAIATLAGTMMTIRNNSEGRTFSSIASAGLTALSYTSYVKAGATIQDMKMLHDGVLTHIKNIENLLQQFVTQEVTLLDKFFKILNNKHVHVEVNIPMSNEVKKMKDRLTGFNWGFWLSAFFILLMLNRYYEERDGEDIPAIMLIGFACWYFYMKRNKLKKEIAEKETVLERSRLKVWQEQ